MFTGIVQEVGRVISQQSLGGDLRLIIGTKKLDQWRAAPGDSISVQGVCLTVVAIEPQSFAADVSRETLSLTTLGELGEGALVNLEPALRAGDALGGHLVSGHVDGMAQVVSVVPEARSVRVEFAAAAPLMRYIAGKGSVTIDGVSLTVNDAGRESFGVNLIPHTQSVTTLGRLAPGARVNLEVDQIARYVDRLLGAR